ncbi:MAG: hypothetical protein ACT4RN_12175 [Pseudonocardia sp.]
MMRMPGFTAEAATRSRGAGYRRSIRPVAPSTTSIVPAESGFHYIGTICEDHVDYRTWVEWDSVHKIEIYHMVPFRSC